MYVSLKERLLNIFKFRESFKIRNALFYKDYLEETLSLCPWICYQTCLQSIFINILNEHKNIKQDKKFIIKRKIKHFLSVVLQISPERTQFCRAKKTRNSNNNQKTDLTPLRFILANLFPSPSFLFSKLECKFFQVWR